MLLLLTAYGSAGGGGAVTNYDQYLFGTVRTPSTLSTNVSTPPR